MKLFLHSKCENCGHDYALHTIFAAKNVPCITCGCNTFKFDGKEYYYGSIRTPNPARQKVAEDSERP